MFEAAELGRKIPKREFAARLPELRSRLLQAHFALRGAKSPVYVVISGVDGAGKGEIVHRLNEWLDPRGVDTHAFWQSSDEEDERPYYWRFWRTTPVRGRVGIFFGSWYTDPIVRRVYHKTKPGEFDHALERIASFEKMLADDGAIFVKLWLHLSKKTQKKTLKDLERDPRSHWRVLSSDWEHHKLYDRFVEVSERAIRHTDAGHAPWHIIEATDQRYRELTAGRIILEAIEARLAEVAKLKNAPKPATPPPLKRVKNGLTVLSRVDLKQKLSEGDYRHQLAKYQAQYNRLIWEAQAKGCSSVIVFEGWDAAGKGSSIRRVTEASDPRLHRIVSIAAPTDEERAHHYLWRFWRHLPRAGMTTIYDRSWYGRVLVERVEGFATTAEWMRSYQEINEFEEQLVEHGIVVSKFWLHISKDEQLRRFKKREEIPYKQYKITDEDWRNRAKWDAYESAVHDMVTHTSTEFAPWTLVAGNDKRFARIQILKTLCEHLEAAL